MYTLFIFNDERGAVLKKGEIKMKSWKVVLTNGAV
jgi:hypothetical protein